ncbi:MAG: hypothetical protein QOJ79_52 [Actinomycetota bacterium]|nr:hypothetical protein [Actinomycetota bacterium]
MTASWHPPDPTAALPTRLEPGQARFRADLGWAVDVCRRQPWLPLLSLLIGVAPVLTGAGRHRTVHDGVVTSSSPSPGMQFLFLVAAVAVFVLLGWPGTQRLWFLRAATGRTMSAGEALRVTKRYFGRFFVLGLVFMLFAIPVTLPVVVSSLHGLHRLPDGTMEMHQPAARWLAVTAAGTIVLDALFTFVTPALVLTSHRVGDALRIGFRLLRVTWPHAAAYVFIPPLAAVVVSLYAGFSPAVSVPLVAVSTLVNLVVKGATVAFYLRLVPAAGLDGALVLAPVRADPWSR